MTKHIVSTLILFTGILHASAQKEVYFSNKKTDDIKVENLQGIDFTYSPFRSFSSVTTTFPFSVSYFHEGRIAPSWTLNKTIGLYFSADHNSYYTIDPITHMYDPNSTIKEWDYNLGITGSIEPRWYWQYQDRVLKGKHSALNSGWFVSFPLSLTTGLAHSPNFYDDTWFYHSFSLTTKLYPSVGYRYALSDKLFLESKLGAGPVISIGQWVYASIEYSLDVRVAWKF